MIKKILVFTSSRADYGIMSSLIKKFSRNKNFNLYLIVTGTHLDKSYGYTLSESESDKVKVKKKIKIKTDIKNSLDIINSSSDLLTKFSKTLKKVKPDVVLILGDRYETFVAAISSYILKYPIAHIHGGETTFGSQDEGFRHSITKLSNIHFVTNKTYYNRVLQLGESPKNIYLVGSLGSENIKFFKKVKKFQNKKLRFNSSKKNLLITFHPETMEKDNGRGTFNTLLNFLMKLENYYIIFTSPNADSNTSHFKKKINYFIKKKKNCSYIRSFGKNNYYSLLKNVDCMIGNSSSGIIETPLFNLPVINLGNRQKGRVMPKNIINISNNITNKKLKKSLELALSQNFKKRIKGIKDPNYKKYTSDNIIKIIKKINFNKFKIKEFHDFRK